MTEVLKDLALFRDIAPAEIETMLRCLNSRVRTFKKDEFVFLAGESAPKVGIVLAGLAQVIKENIHGDRLTMRTLGAGEMFGETYASLGVRVIPVSVIALEETRVIEFELKSLVLTCESACAFHRKLILNLMRIIAQKNAVLSEQMYYLSHKTIRGRLEAYLLDCVDKSGSLTVNLPFNRREMAEFLCMDRTAMQREMAKMKEEGVLDYYKNTFKILF